MKLSDFLPPSDLLKEVEGVESGLRQRYRLGRIGLAVAAIQVVVLLYRHPELSKVPGVIGQVLTGNFSSLSNLNRPWLIFLCVLVGVVLLTGWARFWMDESQAPFRYTYSIADFKPVAADDKPDWREESLSLHLSHDLAQRLNERITRLSLLEEEQTKPGEQVKPDAPAKNRSHIHIKGHYLVRQKPNGDWFIEVMPRVRIGPAGSAETLAHTVRFKLGAGVPPAPPKTDAAGQPAPPKADTARPPASPKPDTANQPAALKPPQIDARQYEQILERVYFSIATEIYKQIQADVQRKIELLPSDYYRAVALFYEAEDYAASNTLDAYTEALDLYEQAIQYFDPSTMPPKTWRAPRLFQWVHQQLSKTAVALKRWLSWIIPRFGKMELMCARAEIGYTNMLIYQRSLASMLAQRIHPPFEARPMIKSALKRIKHVSPDVQGRNEFLFDAYVAQALVWQAIGSTRRAKECLEECRRINPARAEINAKYLFAAGDVHTLSSEKLQCFERAVELEPRFDAAQFSKALQMEYDWRKRPAFERNMALRVIREYEELLKTNPGNVGAWSNIGYIRWLLDDTDKAKEAFELGREYKEIKRETFVAELDHCLARIEAEAGNFDAAYGHFANCASAFLALGVAHSAQGQTDDFYHYVLINQPMLERFESYRARVEKRRERWIARNDENGVEVERTFPVLLAALKITAERMDALATLAGHLERTEQRLTEQDRNIAQAWIKQHAGGAIADLLAGGTLEKFAESLRSKPAGDWNDALCDAMAAALAQDQLVDLMNRYWPKRRILDAVHASVLEDYASACYKFYQRTGDDVQYENAGKAYKSARERNPDFTLAHYHSYLYDGARAHLDKVRELEPNWPDGKLARMMLLVDSNSVKKNREDAKAKRSAAEEKRQASKAKIAEANKLRDEAKANREKAESEQKAAKGLREAAARKQGEQKPAPSSSDEFAHAADKALALQILAGVAQPAALAPPELDQQWLEIKRREEAADKCRNTAGACERIARQLEEESRSLNQEAAELKREADECEGSAKSQIDECLRSLAPHDWLWDKRRNLDARAFAQAYKWEREFNALHARAFQVWVLANDELSRAETPATAPKADRFDPDKLHAHIRDHFWPEDYNLLRMMRQRAEMRRQAGESKDSSESLDSGEVEALSEKMLEVIGALMLYEPFSMLGLISQDNLFSKARKRQAYLDAAAIPSLSTDCNRLLGNLFFDLGEYREAIRLYRRVLDAGVSDEKAKLRIALSLLALGEEKKTDESATTGQRFSSRVNRWRTAVVWKSLDSITTLDSYRQLKTRLEVERRKCRDEKDDDGARDAQEAILVLTREKFFSFVPRGASAAGKYSVVTPIVVEIPARIFPNAAAEARLLDQLNQMCDRLRRQMGVPIPQPRISRDGEGVLYNSYLILINETPITLGEIEPDRQFCPRYKTFLPAFNAARDAYNPETGEMDGAWVDDAQVDAIEAAGGQVWNHRQYISHHMEAVLRTDLIPFLGLQEVCSLLKKWSGAKASREPWDTSDGKDERRQALIDEAVGDISSKVILTQLLQGLVRESVPIANLLAILRVCREEGLKERNLFDLIEAARLKLKGELPGNDASCTFVYLSPAFEEEIQRWVWRLGGKQFFAIPPEKAQELLAAFRAAAGAPPQAKLTVVTRNADVRPFVRRLIEMEFPRVTVLSERELRPQMAGRVDVTVEYDNKPEP